MTYAAEVAADSPAGWWPLDGDLLDASGNGRNGTAVGTLTTVSGPSPGLSAFGFDGSACITVADDNVWSSASFTVEAWVRSRNVSTTAATIVRKAGVVPGAAEWLMSDGAANTLRGRINNDDNDTWLGVFSGDLSPHRCPRNAWHHCVVTFTSSTHTLRCYRDGVLEDEDSTPNGNREGNLATPLVIGAAHQTVTEPWVGDIAHVAVYAAALSETRVQMHYAAMPPLPRCGATGWKVGFL